MRSCRTAADLGLRLLVEAHSFERLGVIEEPLDLRYPTVADRMDRGEALGQIYAAGKADSTPFAAMHNATIIGFEKLQRGEPSRALDPRRRNPLQPRPHGVRSAHQRGLGKRRIRKELHVG